MSSMRNAVQRRNHKERAQPIEREKWGVLEKHKDYSLRAKDYNEKKKRLKILRHKAADRNPDEFHFGMMRSKTDDKGQKHTDRGNPTLSQDAIKLLKTQDAGYLKTMAQKTRKARERSEHGLILREGKGAEVLGDDLDQEHQQHVIFTANRDEQKRLGPQEYSTITEDGLDWRFNHPRIGQIKHPKGAENEYDEMQGSQGEIDDWKARRIDAREALALKVSRTLRKHHKRVQEARKSNLKALRMREKNLMAAEQALDLQRAKMSNGIGGVTKSGMKWKIRERKR